MQAQDITSYAQTLEAEPTAGQRWTQGQLISFADRAQKLIVRTLKWPYSRQIFQSIPSVQEYQIQEVIRILGVYINGQPIVMTNIPTLEGQQIQMNDQTGTGGGPGGLVSNTQAPDLAGGNYTPQWTGQVAASYPVMSQLSAPSPAAQPWIAGMRPRYYMRGGNLGFVPPPMGAYPVVVDCIMQPFTLVNPTDTCVLPDIALDACAWKVAELMSFSDSAGNGKAPDQRGYANKEYQNALANLRAWKREVDGVGSRGPNVLPLRSFYQTGQNRNYGGGNDF